MLIDENKLDTKLPRILRAALELFVERGIHATTTAAIAKRARTAEGTLYRHFKSKDDLANHLFSVHLIDLTHNLYKVIRPFDDPRMQLRAAIEHFYAYFERDPVLFSFIFLAQHNELRNYPRHEDTPWETLLSILQHAQKLKLLRKIDLDLATAMLLGLITRVAEQKVIGTLHGDLRQYVDEVTAAAWRVIEK